MKVHKRRANHYLYTGNKGEEIIIAALTGKNADANAEHLLKCWNAFEKKGLVVKLLAMCKKIMNCADVGLNSDEIKRGKILAEIGYIAEQAIAKAKKEITNG